MIRKRGLFTIYTLRETGYFSITLTACDNQPWGWEWGWDDPLASRHPWFQIRAGKLMVFSFEKFNDGFEIWVMGLWLIL